MIAWEEAGSGPPIVLVHGNTEDRRGWDPVVALLEDSFRCVRLDLRGHGESSDADDYGPLTMADDVATVVAEAGIDEPPFVVGHSLGAVVVTAYAAQAPTRGVVNVDQGLELGGFAGALQSIEPMLRGDSFHEALDMVFANLGTDKIPSPWREWAEAKHAAARQEVVVGTWQLIFDSSADELRAIVDDLLARVTVPYLALHGGDPGDGYADWLTARVPSASLEVWDGDGHYPHLVEPERFAARIRTFAAS
jgi:pimeloyl-ACP methyl ester carboxylesterase